jgi:hypothetical protein
MSAWLEGAILKPESYSKEREALPGHAAVKQKQLKAKQSTPEVRSKKRTAAPDQPWETEFLVRNAGRSPNCPDHLFVGEPS